MKAACPNACKEETFFTTAHVAQTWKVNDVGDFISELSTNDTVHPPNKDNTWTCTTCGKEAKVTD